ncbi:glycosyltransferase [Salmonella enterica subsp. enterica serovar Indiana]|nr:glycosyltransferase [Salmonella enterica subsp. enterica serovar Indiana]MCC1972540.1 glycosyltransferase [Salmonella enterica subsp. enterica serovar Indiana]
MISLSPPTICNSAPIFYRTVHEFNELEKYKVEIIFINDGSKDVTESIIKIIAVSDPLVIPFSFTRNFGNDARCTTILLIFFLKLR